MPKFIAKNVNAGHEVSLEQDGHDVDVCINEIPVLWFDHDTGSVRFYSLRNDDLPDVPRDGTGKRIRVADA